MVFRTITSDVEMPESDIVRLATLQYMVKFSVPTQATSQTVAHAEASRNTPGNDEAFDDTYVSIRVPNHSAGFLGDNYIEFVPIHMRHARSTGEWETLLYDSIHVNALKVNHSKHTLKELKVKYVKLTEVRSDMCLGVECMLSALPCVTRWVYTLHVLRAGEGSVHHGVLPMHPNTH